MRFDDVPAYVMTAVVIALIGEAGLLALDAFSNSLTEGSTAWYAVNNMTTFISNIYKQLPTAGTMIGIGVMLVVILGVFYWRTTRRR